MKKFLLFTALITGTAGLLGAHEFWLQPNKFIYQWGEIINIRLLVGENFEGENWNGNKNNINSLRLYLGDATDDLSKRISDTSQGDSLRFAIYDEGTYVLSYNSKNTFIELDSLKFLAYLQEDGLQEAIDYRAANKETASPGREYYQRSVKTLFQVGEQTSALYKKDTGLPLEITPGMNPYDVKPNDSLVQMEVKVTFQQKPLINQLVKIWYRHNDQTIKQELTSDSSGVVRFTVQPTGRWMVSTVKMVHLPGDPKAQWQSYWGSCTWGYE